MGCLKINRTLQRLNRSMEVQSKAGCLLAVRVRGSAGVPDDIENILKTLGLKRVNMAKIFEDTPETRGALRKVKDRVFWSEANSQILTKLFKARSGLTDGYVKESFGVDIQSLAEMLTSGRLRPKDLEAKGLKTVFKLHPPKGGFKRSLKNPEGRGGEVGYRKETFKQTIERMI
ncbi:MAG: uL30 family ribosomal protein [Candidatus Bathyarchaeia archaeon]|nr:uL30 family ribosomal protein [Candidatus Bathyarchaeota archaeon]